MYSMIQNVNNKLNFTYCKSFILSHQTTEKAKQYAHSFQNNCCICTLVISILLRNSLRSSVYVGK